MARSSVLGCFYILLVSRVLRAGEEQFLISKDLAIPRDG